MGIVTFLPIQEGEGTPSPENVRPIRAPLNIDGIGEIYGGELDTTSGVLSETYFRCVVDGSFTVNVGGANYNGTEATNRFFWSPTHFIYNHPKSHDVPAYSNKAEFVNENIWGKPDQSLGLFTLNSYNQIHINFNHSDIGATAESTQAERNTLIKAWLAENPMEFVLPARFPVDRTLTTAQLHQALDQLGVAMPNMGDIRRRISLNTPHLVTPASAALQTFETDMKAPLKECRVHFSPVQEGSGDPSPDNIRPITGWTGIRAGVRRNNVLNLLAEQHESTPTSSSASTKRSFVPGSCVIGIAPSNYYRANYANYISDLSITDSSLSFTSGAASGYGVGYVLDWLKPGDSVIFSRDTATYMAVHLTAYKADGTFINYQTMGSVARIVPDEAATVLLVFSAGASNSECSITNPMLEIGSTATAYEPYQGKTFTLDWTNEAGTIYGGYIDLASGELVQEWYTISIDETAPMRTFVPDGRNQGKYCNANYWLSTFNAPNAAGYKLYSYDGYCDKLLYYENNYALNTRAAAYNSTADICLEGVRPREDYLSWLAENGPITITYRLAVPIRYQIDPVKLKTLRGINNIWSSSNGSIDLTYWKH